jgi:hypothetical protein
MIRYVQLESGCRGKKAPASAGSNDALLWQPVSGAAASASTNTRLAFMALRTFGRWLGSVEEKETRSSLNISIHLQVSLTGLTISVDCALMACEHLGKIYLLAL